MADVNLPREGAIRRGRRWVHKVQFSSDLSGETFDLTFGRSRFDVNTFDGHVDDSHAGDPDDYILLILEEDETNIESNLIDAELTWADEAYSVTWTVPVIGSLQEPT